MLGGFAGSSVYMYIYERRKGGDSPFGQSDRLANALTYGTTVSAARSPADAMS